MMIKNMNETHLTYEQSRKPWVHGKDIHKFGKVPSHTTRLYNNDIGVSLAGNCYIYIYIIHKINVQFG